MVDTYQFIVNKYKLDVGRQYIVEIPNMGRNDLAMLFSELDFNKGAEIGVDMGHYSEVLCKANPNLKLYGVDPYAINAYEKEIDPQQAGIHTNQDGFEGNYEKALNRLAPYKNYTFVRQPSLGALREFEDESLDFVYIDANHDFPNFINDLHNWKKKVRKGGIVSGHDYANYPVRKFNHVKRALDAYVRSYAIIPLFIAGTDEVREGETRDRYRSWFYVK